MDEGLVVRRRSRHARRERERRGGFFDVDPLDLVRRPARLRGGEIGVRLALDRQHLEPTLIVQAAGFHRVRCGDVPEEARWEREVVLGQVEDSLGRVERDGLVREASGLRDRLSVGLPVRRHLEDEPVRLLERHVRGAGEVRAYVGAIHRLLAGDPAAPRHPPTRAVHHRAVEAGVRLDNLTGRRRHDRRCPAQRPRVIWRAWPEGRARWLAGWRVVELVVAHEDDVAIGPGERAHPVVPAGQRGAVVERYGEFRVME